MTGEARARLRLRFSVAEVKVEGADLAEAARARRGPSACADLTGFAPTRRRAFVQWNLKFCEMSTDPAGGGGACTLAKIFFTISA